MKNKTQSIYFSEVKTVLETIPKGSIFTVEFEKADGTIRTMNCRTGVKAYLKPNPTRIKSANPASLVTVYDMQKGAYRSFNTYTVNKIKACGQVFEVK